MHNAAGAPSFFETVNITEKRGSAEDRIVITVTRSQEVFVEKERVDIARLGGVLGSIRKSKPQVNVYLRADKNAPYGAVVQVMDTVKRAGIDKLGMVTEAAPPGDETGK